MNSESASGEFKFDSALGEINRGIIDLGGVRVRARCQDDEHRAIPDSLLQVQPESSQLLSRTTTPTRTYSSSREAGVGGREPE